MYYIPGLYRVQVTKNSNAATLGSSKCSHGPTYWCGSIKQAKECGAVQYCSDNDWAAIRTKAGEFCNDCEIGVGLLTEQLEKASTEDEIIQIVEKFCTDLGALAEDCRLVVNAYGPEMLKALIEKLQPDQVCALLGFCKPDTSVTDPQEVLLSQACEELSQNYNSSTECSEAEVEASMRFTFVARISLWLCKVFRFYGISALVDPFYSQR
ncbi:hypothetical protein BSL78_12331 [Apostichopus japonicus]|uniref:Prosaposin n=1 Tax=Stichopus japonicus TaxID=307972 RepID=A0A2G8KS19_STIJA|nr:hypothetical protein BSL78_12331 [Apostichopus japonicus]